MRFSAAFLLVIVLTICLSSPLVSSRSHSRPIRQIRVSVSVDADSPVEAHSSTPHRPSLPSYTPESAAVAPLAEVRSSLDADSDFEADLNSAHSSFSDDFKKQIQEARDMQKKMMADIEAQTANHFKSIFGGVFKFPSAAKVFKTVTSSSSSNGGPPQVQTQTKVETLKDGVPNSQLNAATPIDASMMVMDRAPQIGGPLVHEALAHDPAQPVPPQPIAPAPVLISAPEMPMAQPLPPQPQQLIAPVPVMAPVSLPSLPALPFTPKPVPGGCMIPTGPMEGIELGKRVFIYVNEFRQQMNLPQFHWDDSAAQVSLGKAIQLSQTQVLSHIGFDDRVNCLPYVSHHHAENIGKISTRPLDAAARIVVQRWIESPTHYKNLIGDFNSCGIAAFTDSQNIWFAQLFTKK